MDKDLNRMLDDFIEQLDEALPEVDFQHRDEIFDIAALLKARFNKFITNYGLN